MSSLTMYQQSLIVFWGTIVLYMTALIWMSSKGWLFRAGLSSAIIASMPLSWQYFFVENAEASTTGFTKLFFCLSALSMLFGLMGLIFFLGRSVNKLAGKKNKEEEE